MVWHAFLKEILTRLFEAREFIVQAEFEIGTLPLKIDLVIKKNHVKIPSPTKVKDHSEQKLTESPLSSSEAEYLTTFINYFSNWNLFEFKLMDETVTSSKLAKLIGYFGLFCEKKQLPLQSIKDTTSWLLCTRKPRKLFNQLIRENYQLESLPIQGFYKLQFYIPIILVVINELPVEEDFLPVLLFAKGKKRHKVLNFILDKNNKLFINWSYVLYQDELITLAKAKDKPLDEITKNVRKTIHGLGLKSVIDAVGPKKVIEAMGLKEVIDIVGLKEVIDAVGLKEVIDAVGLKEVIDIVGLKEVIDAVGLKEVIDAVGLKEVIDTVEPKELAKQLDLETLEEAIEEKKKTINDKQ